jgi:hypothetical protein
VSYTIAREASPSSAAARDEANQEARRQADELDLAVVHSLYNSTRYTWVGAVLAAATFWVAYLGYTHDRRILIWAVAVHAAQMGRLAIKMAGNTRPSGAAATWSPWCWGPCPGAWWCWWRCPATTWP